MKTILIVDDELAIREILTAVLQDEGYHVIEASNGKEGLDRLRADRPDLVLTDVMMPVMDGRELLGAARTDPAIAGTPIIVMSAALESFVGGDLGQDAALRKPFTIEQVLEPIKRLLDQRSDG